MRNQSTYDENVDWDRLIFLRFGGTAGLAHAQNGREQKSSPRLTSGRPGRTANSKAALVGPAIRS